MTTSNIDTEKKINLNVKFFFCRYSLTIIRYCKPLLKSIHLHGSQNLIKIKSISSFFELIIVNHPISQRSNPLEISVISNNLVSGYGQQFFEFKKTFMQKKKYKVQNTVK